MAAGIETTGVPRLVGRGTRQALGLLLGSGTALVALGYLLLCGFLWGPALAHPGLRRTARRGADRLVDLERRRLATFLGDVPVVADPGGRVVAYLGVRAVVGLLGGAVLALFGYGVLVGVVWIWQWASGEASALTFAAELVSGAIGLFVFLQGFDGLVALERRLALRYLGPSEREVLRRRISELAASRAGVVAAVDAERRRIERDLHDGVQQRLVALGLLVGRARRATDAARARELMGQVHEETGQILAELREVAWRVYPTALDNLGLADAVARVAEGAGVPVDVAYRLAERPPRDVETAAYFVVSEAVTNAVKHAAPQRVRVDVARRADRLVVGVVDDGVGGADPTGTGLSGLARRVAALDGELRVDSPAGGPTSVVAELPCG